MLDVGRSALQVLHVRVGLPAAGRPGSPPAPDYVGRTCALISLGTESNTRRFIYSHTDDTRLLKSPHGRFGNEKNRSLTVVSIYYEAQGCTLLKSRELKNRRR